MSVLSVVGGGQDVGGGEDVGGRVDVGSQDVCNRDVGGHDIGGRADTEAVSTVVEEGGAA